MLAFQIQYQNLIPTLLYHLGYLSTILAFYFLPLLLFKIDKAFEVIERPIKIIPENLSFKNYMRLEYDKEVSTGAFFNYNRKKKKWYYMERYNKNHIDTKIYSGGIFAILNENEKPKISNKIPKNNSTYKSNDLLEISFNIKDELSGKGLAKFLPSYIADQLQGDGSKFNRDIDEVLRILSSKATAQGDNTAVLDATGCQNWSVYAEEFLKEG